MLDVVLAGRFCGANEVLAISQCSTALRRATDDDSVWKALVMLRHVAVLRVLFDGAPPEPKLGSSWKGHFFDFERSWLQQARQRSGRLLVRMNAVCAMGCDWPDYGVPWHLDQPNCACRGAVCRGARHAYGVYDVTEFAPQHPGSEALLQAAEVFDATELFDSIAHSPHARRLLRGMAVPGLEAVSSWDVLLPARRPPEDAVETVYELLCSAADRLCRSLSSAQQRLRWGTPGPKLPGSVIARIAGSALCPHS